MDASGKRNNRLYGEPSGSSGVIQFRIGHIKTRLDIVTKWSGARTILGGGGTPNVQEGRNRDLDQEVPILTTSSIEHPSKAKSPR